MANALVPQANRACIDVCTDCVQACEACAQDCLGHPAMAGCARLCLDCATICQACTTLLARGSAFAGRLCQLCAEICDACAAECERFDMELPGMRPLLPHLRGAMPRHGRRLTLAPG